MVVKPPLERPKPCRGVPSSTRCLMMGPDHGAVDHLRGAWHSPAFVQGLHDLLPESRQHPAPELAVDARPLAKLFRQIALWRAGPGNPEYPIKNKPVVGGFASVRRARRKDETLKERPFFVRHKVSCQAGLHRRYQLEARLALPVNLFFQHDLAPTRSAKTPIRIVGNKAKVRPLLEHEASGPLSCQFLLLVIFTTPIRWFGAQVHYSY